MGRIARLLTAIGAVAILAPSSTAAQAVRPLHRGPRVAVPPSPVAPWSPVAPLRRVDTSERASNRRAVTTSVSVVGGALLGSFLGYFMSQVVKSDWEGERTGDRADHRRRFTISGAAVGALTGYLVRPRGRRARPEPPRFYVYVAPSARHYITIQELRRAIVTNALEAVQLLRPEWLGAGQFASQTTANGSPSVAAEMGIAVYVVDTRVGGPEALAEVSIPEIQELRLYEPREAARRWGVQHPHGAIEIVPSEASASR